MEDEDVTISTLVIPMHHQESEQTRKAKGKDRQTDYIVTISYSI